MHTVFLMMSLRSDVMRFYRLTPSSGFHIKLSLTPPVIDISLFTA